MNIELLCTDTLEQAVRKLNEETADLNLKIHKMACEEALGFICARDVIAGENVPPFRAVNRGRLCRHCRGQPMAPAIPIRRFIR